MGSEAASSRTGHAGTHRPATEGRMANCRGAYLIMERRMPSAVAPHNGHGSFTVNPFERRVSLPQFTLVVERAQEGARRCGLCASVGSRIVCDPSPRIGRDWTQSRPGLDVVVGLRSVKGAIRPVLRVWCTPKWSTGASRWTRIFRAVRGCCTSGRKTRTAILRFPNRLRSSRTARCRRKVLRQRRCATRSFASNSLPTFRPPLAGRTPQ
jgi:hypothetical protein